MRKIGDFVLWLAGKIFPWNSGVCFLVSLLISYIFTAPVLFVPRVMKAYERSQEHGDNVAAFTVQLIIGIIIFAPLFAELITRRKYWIMRDRVADNRFAFYCFLGVPTYPAVNNYCGKEIVSYRRNMETFIVPIAAEIKFYTGRKESDFFTVPLSEVVNLEFIERIFVLGSGVFYGFKLLLADGQELPFVLARKGTTLNMQMPRAKAYALFEQLRDEIMTRKNDNNENAA